jgi:hypothetical protein
MRNDVKSLEDRFEEIEKRVRTLVTQNKDLKGRIKELDKELAQARRDARQAEQLQGNRLQVRDKIERILESLENATNSE